MVKTLVMSIYKDTYTIEQRRTDFERFINSNRGDRVPVILEVSESSTFGPLKKYKYSVPYDLTIRELIKEVLKEKTISLYLYWDNIYVPKDVIMGPFYDQCKDTDGFLYLKYSDRHSIGKLIRDWTQMKVSWNSFNK